MRLNNRRVSASSFHIFVSCSVSQRGMNLKRKIARAMEKIILAAKETMLKIFEISFGAFFSADSSSSEISAEKLSARIPSTIVSIKFTIPRITGIPNIFTFFVSEIKRSFLWIMAPFGFRTAMVTQCGARIMTPSIKACPPTAKSILFFIAGDCIIFS